MNPSTRGLSINREAFFFTTLAQQIRGWTQSSALLRSSCIVSWFRVSGQLLSTQMKLKTRSKKTTETRIQAAPHTNTLQHQIHTPTHYTLPVSAVGCMICDLTFRRVNLRVRSDLTDFIFHLLCLDGFDQFSVSSASLGVTDWSFLLMRTEPDHQKPHRAPLFCLCPG